MAKLLEVHRKKESIQTDTKYIDEIFGKYKHIVTYEVYVFNMCLE
jgi:hypothetical protein